MSTMVKVFNDNTHEFKSHFKGDPVHIKEKSYWLDDSGEPRVMDIYEATDFKGDGHSILLGADGLQDPKSYKMIKLEKLEVAAASVIESFVCMQCKHKSPSPEELEAHIKFRHSDAQMTSLPEEDNKKKKARA